MSTFRPQREALSIGEAASRLGVHRDTLRSAIARGEIPATRIGRRWLVPIAGLERFLGVGTPSQELKPHDEPQ